MTEDDIKRARELLTDPDGEDCERFASRYGDHLLTVHAEMLAALQGAIGALEFSREYHSDLGNEEQAFAQDKLDAATKAIARATS